MLVATLWSMARLNKVEEIKFVEKIVMELDMRGVDNLEMSHYYLLYLSILKMQEDMVNSSETLINLMDKHFESIKENYIKAEKQLSEDLEQIELSRGGLRMTSKKAYENIADLLREMGLKVKSNARVNGLNVPLWIACKNIAVIVASPEHIIEISKEKVGVMAMKDELLLAGLMKETCNLVNIDLIEYATLGKQSDKIEGLKVKRMDYLMKKISEHYEQMLEDVEDYVEIGELKKAEKKLNVVIEELKGFVNENTKPTLVKAYTEKAGLIKDFDKNEAVMFYDKALQLDKGYQPAITGKNGLIPEEEGVKPASEDHTAAN
jgi:hypothetical protein